MTTGSTIARFTITLSKSVAEPVQVAWNTKDGTAKAGVDYAAASGTAVFSPGETNKDVDVLVYGRAVGTEDRNFFLEMTPPPNAILGESIGECIIYLDTAGNTAVIQVIVPTGPQGDKGDSAYQSWLNLGNTGTEQDFIDSLSPPVEEIAAEVAPLLDVSNSPLTAEGTETLSKPDTMTGKRLARRVAYVGAAKVATVVLADGDNLITHADLSGDVVDFNSISLYPRILRGTAVISPEWSVEPGDKILIKSAVDGDVLHVCQYDIISERAVKNVVEPLVSAALAPVGSQAFEALRRSYAEAGYNLVDGSFEVGGTLINVNDVLLQESTGKVFSGPTGAVAAGTDPASGGFTDKSNIFGSTYAGIRAYTGGATSISCIGRTNVFDGAYGTFALDQSDSTSADNDCTILVGVGGKRWKRQYVGAVKSEWAGVSEGASDNAVAFQNFCNAIPRNGKGKIHAGTFKTGTFKLNSKLARIEGEGSQQTKIELVGANACIKFEEADTFSKLSVKGIGAQVAGSVIFLDDRGGDYADVDVTFDDIYFTGAESISKVWGRGVLFKKCTAFDIRFQWLDLQFPNPFNPGSEDVHSLEQGFRNFRFEDCTNHYSASYFVNNTGYNAVNAKGFSFTDCLLQGSARLIKGYAKDVTVTGNTFQHRATPYNVMDLLGGENIVFIGNNFTRQNTHPTYPYFERIVSATGPIKGFVFTGNTLEGCNGEILRLNHAGSTSSDIVIKGNTYRDCFSTGMALFMCAAGDATHVDIEEVLSAPHPTWLPCNRGGNSSVLNHRINVNAIGSPRVHSYSRVQSLGSSPRQGVYSGTGSDATQTFEIGYEPKILKIFSAGSVVSIISYGTDTLANGAGLAADGKFTVTGAANSSGVIYFWEAS